MGRVDDPEVARDGEHVVGKGVDDSAGEGAEKFVLRQGVVVHGSALD